MEEDESNYRARVFIGCIILALVLLWAILSQPRMADVENGKYGNNKTNEYHRTLDIGFCVWNGSNNSILVDKMVS